MSPGRYRRDDPDERPGAALLRSGLKGIGAVALAVLILGAVAAAIALVISVTF